MRIFLASMYEKEVPAFLTEILNYCQSRNISVVNNVYDLEKLGHGDEKSRSSAMSDQALDVMKNLKDCDVFIGEMSLPSQTLGFLLASALNHGMPSLYLHPENPFARPFPPLAGNPSRLITYASYNSESIETILDSFIEKAAKQLKSDRITFVSTKQINAYIDLKSIETGMSKGEVIRRIIEDAIEREN